MPGVFVSYRRDDSAGHAGALLRELHGRIGGDQVFIDIEDIEAGTAFPAALHFKSAREEVLLRQRFARQGDYAARTARWFPGL